VGTEVGKLSRALWKPPDAVTRALNPDPALARRLPSRGLAGDPFGRLLHMIQMIHWNRSSMARAMPVHAAIVFN
jgi:hypothetical protein